jgi:hypothetical protein
MVSILLQNGKDIFRTEWYQLFSELKLLLFARACNFDCINNKSLTADKVWSSNLGGWVKDFLLAVSRLYYADLKDEHLTILLVTLAMHSCNKTNKRH